MKPNILLLPALILKAVFATIVAVITTIAIVVYNHWPKAVIPGAIVGVMWLIATAPNGVSAERSTSAITKGEGAPTFRPLLAPNIKRMKELGLR